MVLPKILLDFISTVSSNLILINYYPIIIIHNFSLIYNLYKQYDNSTLVEEI